MDTRNTTSVAPRSDRPPWYRDVRSLRILAQVLLVVAAVSVLAILFGNMVVNMERQNISTDFDYLTQSAEFSIPGSSFDRNDSRLDAIVVGVGNTLRIAVAGIILATVLGVLLGIARLSANFLLSTGARLYVEFFRNVPLLVIIVFVYLAVFLQFPRLENSLQPLGIAVVSVRGIHIPWFETGPNTGLFLLVAAAGFVAARVVARRRREIGDRTGMEPHAGLWATGSFLAVVVVAWIAFGGPVTMSVPDLTDRAVAGGTRISPEFAALLVALVLYTASHIAEITRGSIQAVPRGQHEAATALALSPYQRMRQVILPQAFRIAVPPLANQYLNLTKNSSLAVAVSYFEVTKITNDIIGNGGPAPQSYALLMVIYLVISLSIAAISNVVNRRLALVER